MTFLAGDFPHEMKYWRSGGKGWECVDMTRCEKCDACDMNVKYGDLGKWDRPRGCFCKHSSNFASRKKQNVKLHQPNCYSEEITKRKGKSICQKTWKVALKMTESVIVGYLWKDTVYRISTASAEKEEEWNQINLICASYSRFFSKPDQCNEANLHMSLRVTALR